MKTSILALATLALSVCAAQAGTAGAGNLSNPYFMANGVLLIPTDGVRSGVPVCATEPLRFAVDGSTPAGKVQAAGILMAFASGKKVVIWGTGTCSVWGDTETVNFFQVLN